MIPDDTDWFANDGNEEITKDWTNTLQRSTDYVPATNTSSTHPAPTGTTLPNGGGKIIYWQRTAGVAATTEVVIDDLDGRNRFVIVLAGGHYDNTHPNQLPTDAAYSCGGSMALDQKYCTDSDRSFWTSDDGNPGVGGTRLDVDTGVAVVTISADAGNGGKLTLYNGNAFTIYPVLVLLVSDQFDVRT